MVDQGDTQQMGIDWYYEKYDKSHVKITNVTNVLCLNQDAATKCLPLEAYVCTATVATTHFHCPI